MACWSKIEKIDDTMSILVQVNIDEDGIDEHTLTRVLIEAGYTPQEEDQ